MKGPRVRIFLQDQQEIIAAVVQLMNLYCENWGPFLPYYIILLSLLVQSPQHGKGLLYLEFLAGQVLFEVYQITLVA